MQSHVRKMPDSEEPEAPYYVEMALDASCAALMALDLVRTVAPEDERVTGRITLAIAALRHAIEDLREQHPAHGNGLASGFVASSHTAPLSAEHNAREPDRFVA